MFVFVLLVLVRVCAGCGCLGRLFGWWFGGFVARGFVFVVLFGGGFVFGSLCGGVVALVVFKNTLVLRGCENCEPSHFFHLKDAHSNLQASAHTTLLPP